MSGAHPQPGMERRDEVLVRDRTPPARRRRQLAGDLDNIVLKALRKEPGRRYVSVEQFAEDMRRYLDGRPVSATPDSLHYRIGKFLRRHKASTLAFALSAAALLAGTIATMREAHVAEANAQRAERRFNDVRKLANSLVFEIHDSVQDLPGSTPVRELIVQRALEYLDSLARESTGDPSLQRELAAAYRRIGDVQGYQYRANLGDTPAALQSYRKALEIRRAIYGSNPGNTEDELALAESLRLVSETLLVTGNARLALDNIREATVYGEHAMHGRPESIEVLEELSREYEAQANILGGDFNLSNLGDNTGALPLRQKQLEMSERAAALRPDDPAVRLRLAGSIAMLGDQLGFDGRRRAARDHYRRSVQFFEELALHSPSPRVLNFLDDSYERLATVEISDGDVRDAERIARKALQVAHQLNRADPRNVLGKLTLAVDYGILAEASSRNGHPAVALAAAVAATEGIDAVLRISPDNTEFLGIQGETYLTAAGVLGQFRHFSQALRLYRSAQAVFSKVQAREPQNPLASIAISVGYNGIGLTLAEMGEHRTAAESFGKAQTRSPSPDESEEGRYARATSYAGLGEVESRLAEAAIRPQERINHWQAAKAMYELSIDTWRQVKEPGELSPNGFRCVSKRAVLAELEKARRTLRALNDRNTPGKTTSLAHDTNAQPQ